MLTSEQGVIVISLGVSIRCAKKNPVKYSALLIMDHIGPKQIIQLVKVPI